MIEMAMSPEISPSRNWRSVGRVRSNFTLRISAPDCHFLSRAHRVRSRLQGC